MASRSTSSANGLVKNSPHQAFIAHTVVGTSIAGDEDDRQVRPVDDDLLKVEAVGWYQRVARCGMRVAVVAAARKLTVLCWHLIIKEEDYVYTQPSLSGRAQAAQARLHAGLPPHRGRPGKATGYSLHAVQAAERGLAAQAEAAYRTMVAAW